MSVLTNLSPFDINPDFNAARLLYTTEAQEVRDRKPRAQKRAAVLVTTRPRRERPPRLLEGVLPVGHLLSNQCSRTFCFHEAAIAPAFHSRELRGELQ